MIQISALSITKINKLYNKEDMPLIFLQVEIVTRNEILNEVVNRDTDISNDCEIKNKYERKIFFAEDYYMNIYKPIDNTDIVCRN